MKPEGTLTPEEIALARYFETADHPKHHVSPEPPPKHDRSDFPDSRQELESPMKEPSLPPAEGRPLVVPLADAARFKYFTGLSPATARRLHVREGFPLRARGRGQRRSWYALLDEVEKWWKRQSTE